MSMVASDIGTIPVSGFAWYVLYQEEAWDDPINAELRNNFLEVGRQVGPDVLVIRGYDPDKFYASAFETQTLYGTEANVRPSLLISDTAPRLLLDEPAKLKSAKLISIPLAPLRGQPPGAVVDILRQLVAALKDEDALHALQRLEKGPLQKSWGWMRKYAELRPNFLGFGLNINAILDDALSRTSNT